MNTLINGIGRGLAFRHSQHRLRDVGGMIATGRSSTPGGRAHPDLADNPSISDHFQGIGAGVYVDTIEAGRPLTRATCGPTT